MPRLEEIAYDIARAALADQQTRVDGLRSRTSTLVAAQALVASFLGGAALDRGPLDVWGWAAVTMLAAGLALAAAILAPWRMTFVLDARQTYRRLAQSAEDEASGGTLGWLVTAALAHDRLRRRNDPTVRRMTVAAVALTVLTIVQTVLWIVAIGVR